jgi:hypothetical protein
MLAQSRNMTARESAIKSRPTRVRGQIEFQVMRSKYSNRTVSVPLQETLPRWIEADSIRPDRRRSGRSVSGPGRAFGGWADRDGEVCGARFDAVERSAAPAGRDLAARRTARQAGRNIKHDVSTIGRSWRAITLQAPPVRVGIGIWALVRASVSPP